MNLFILDPTSQVVAALANGFQNYSSIIKRKKSLSDGKASKILDEMSSKVNAWHSALSLTLLILQCDSVLINGFTDKKASDTMSIPVNTL